MLRPISAVCVAVLLSFTLLGAAPYASADVRSDCEAAVKAKFDKKVPKAKKFKFGNKVKSVADAKKGREEISGTGKYVGREGQSKEMGWKCVIKGGKVEDVNLKLEE